MFVGSVTPQRERGIKGKNPSDSELLFYTEGYVLKYAKTLPFVC